jgi:hypothetical protein
MTYFPLVVARFFTITLDKDVLEHTKTYEHEKETYEFIVKWTGLTPTWKVVAQFNCLIRNLGGWAPLTFLSLIGLSVEYGFNSKLFLAAPVALSFDLVVLLTSIIQKLSNPIFGLLYKEEHI